MKKIGLVLGTIILLHAAGWLLLATSATAYHYPFTIGLVEVPAIFGKRGYEGGNGPIYLRKAPSLRSPVAQIITERDQLHHDQHGYEVYSAVVYQVVRKSGRWFQVGYSVEGRGGKGWLPAKNAGKYRPLMDLLGVSDNLLAKLMKNWDGRLYEYPSQKAPFKYIGHIVPHFTPIAVARERRVKETPWFLVVLIKEDVCGSGKFLNHVVAAGWVPAFNSEGEMNLWFSARGC